MAARWQRNGKTSVAFVVRGERFCRLTVRPRSDGERNLEVELFSRPGTAGAGKYTARAVNDSLAKRAALRACGRLLRGESAGR